MIILDHTLQDRIEDYNVFVELNNERQAYTYICKSGDRLFFSYIGSNDDTNTEDIEESEKEQYGVLDTDVEIESMLLHFKSLDRSRIEQRALDVVDVLLAKYGT